MEDYYRQCLVLEGLLDEFEPDRQKAAGVLNSMTAEVGDNPRLTPTIDLFKHVTEKDSQVITALRAEIADAKQLYSLPYYKQKAFYEQKIAPIRSEIERLAADEITLLREAQQKGVTLPSDISELLKKD